MTDGPIRLLLADDHPGVRQAIACAFAVDEDVEIVGLAADGAEAVRLAGELRPDVVVMDFSMPRLDGAEAARRIAAEAPGVAVVGLSMHEGEVAAGPMLAAGAAAYLSKATPFGDLVRAVHMAAGR